VVYKTVTPVTVGNSAQYGGDDINKIANLLNGQSSDAVTIGSNWTFKSTFLKLRNPANTFSYSITSGAITADRILNLPITSGTDTITTDASTSTFINKTMSGTANTFTGIPKSSIPSSIMYNDGNNNFGSFYEDISQIGAPANPPSGTRRVFMDTNTGKLSVKTSAGTVVSLEEQPTVSGFAKGKATFSGNGSLGSFSTPHGLGVTPSSISVTPGSAHASGSSFNYTVYATCDATNITFRTSSGGFDSGTNNLIWFWQAWV
jgi:hypothetical protein